MLNHWVCGVACINNVSKLSLTCARVGDFASIIEKRRQLFKMSDHALLGCYPGYAGVPQDLTNTPLAPVDSLPNPDFAQVKTRVP